MHSYSDAGLPRNDSFGGIPVGDRATDLNYDMNELHWSPSGKVGFRELHPSRQKGGTQRVGWSGQEAWKESASADKTFPLQDVQEAELHHVLKDALAKPRVSSPGLVGDSIDHW